MNAMRGKDWGLQFYVAGLGMMASKNPQALGAIGEGGLKAVQYMVESKKNDSEIRLKNAQSAGLELNNSFIPGQTAVLRAGLGGQSVPQVPLGVGPTAGLAPSKGIAGPAVSSQAVDSSLPPEARAFLDTIAGPESKGAYNVRYTPTGGATFNSFDRHPNIAEPGPEGPSTAAGRYQITKSTWDPLAAKLGLNDFSPKSQDDAAWQNAQDAYGRQTGGDLLTDLKAGKLNQVQNAMRNSRQWDTASMGAYASNLAKYQNGESPGSVVASGDQPAAPSAARTVADTSGSSPAATGQPSSAQPASPEDQAVYNFLDGQYAETQKYIDFQRRLMLASPPSQAEGLLRNIEQAQLRLNGLQDHDPRIQSSLARARATNENTTLSPGQTQIRNGQVIASAPQRVTVYDPKTNTPFESWQNVPVTGPGGVPMGSGASTGAASRAGLATMGGAPVQSGANPVMKNDIDREDKTMTEARESFDKAQGSQVQLDAVDRDIETLNKSGWSSTGSGANDRIGFAKDLNSALGVLGISPIFDQNKIASWEDITKESTRLGFELSRTLGSREAQQVVQTSVRAVPNSENTYLGARLVSNGLRQAAQRQIDYYQFLNDWRGQNNGRLVGTDDQGKPTTADIQFNLAHPPAAYARAAVFGAIPDQAKAALQAQPAMAQQFDAKYGPGMASAVLGQR